MRQELKSSGRRAKRQALLLAVGAIGLAVVSVAPAQAQAQAPRYNPNYIAPVPGQNLSPPAPRQNLSPPPPPTTRPSEGDSSTRIQGGSTRRMPLPTPQNGQ